MQHNESVESKDSEFWDVAYWTGNPGVYILDGYFRCCARVPDVSYGGGAELNDDDEHLQLVSEVVSCRVRREERRSDDDYKSPALHPPNVSPTLNESSDSKDGLQKASKKGKRRRERWADVTDDDNPFAGPIIPHYQTRPPENTYDEAGEVVDLLGSVSPPPGLSVPGQLIGGLETSRSGPIGVENTAAENVSDSIDMNCTNLRFGEGGIVLLCANVPNTMGPSDLADWMNMRTNVFFPHPGP